MGILDKFRLDGRTAVVTGAGKGIGRGIAVALAEAGANVVVASRTRADLEETAALVIAAGRKALVHPIDVTAPGALEALAEAAVAEFGAIEIWVNNAGGLPDAKPRYMTRTSPEQFDAQISLNLTAVFSGCVAAANHMKNGGSIINISSRAAKGLKSTKKNGPYAASKAAVNSLTITLAMELAPKIRVNAIGPGPIPTQNFMESVGGPQVATEAWADQVPLGRLGEPEDIGAAAVFLASDASSWITGECIFVTGG